MMLANSPVDSFNFAGRKIYVKRDDLLHPEFSGNKARKLKYFLINDFPHIDTIVSYGGTQSNLMYSLAALAKLKRWQFIYYANQPSQMAVAQSSGNLAASLANGMQLITTTTKLSDFIKQLTLKSNQLFIPQGGADQFAAHGIQELANEIRLWANETKITELAIFVPSGTGVTALYLQHFLPEYTVYTTNCVGSVEYLTKQWNELDASIQKPIILANEQYRFATPDLQLWQTIQAVQQQSSIQFDLVYDPLGWEIVLTNLDSIFLPILYIHCGGLVGNLSMNQRYNYFLTKNKKVKI